MPKNEVTGTHLRAQKPDLQPGELALIVRRAREADGDEITYGERQYWADPDGKVYVVAWRCGETGRTSGDLISGDPQAVSGDQA